MNRKTWFYGGLMVLLMVTATYIAINADSNSWEDIRGRQSPSACDYVSHPPKDAPSPPDCKWVLGVCKDPHTNGTHGYCDRTEDGSNTGSTFKENTLSHGHIIKKRRICNVDWFSCDDDGVDNTYGTLNKCVLTAC